MLKCFHGWTPSSIHNKLFREAFFIAEQRHGYKDINTQHASHFFIEGFRAARNIVEADNSTSTNTPKATIALDKARWALEMYCDITQGEVDYVMDAMEKMVQL